MKRRELRERIFEILFRVEFMNETEMEEQIPSEMDEMLPEDMNKSFIQKSMLII